MKVFNILLLVLLTTGISNAQSGVSFTDSRAAAMSSYLTASSNGVFSIGKNPANLALQSDHNFEIATVFPLPNINLFVGNDFMTVNDFNYFFSGEKNAVGETVGKFLNTSDKQKFKDLFSNGTGITSNISTILFGFSVYVSPKIGAFGISMSDKFAAQADVPQDLISLLLDGNTVERQYDLNGFDVKSWYLREYSLSYARELTKYFHNTFKNITAGISFKLIHGFGYLNLIKSDTKVTTRQDYSIEIRSNNLINSAFSPSFGVVYDFEDTTKSSSVGLFNKPAGTGLGLDFGVSGKVNDIWSFGVSITDVGSIKWNKDVAQYTASGNYTLSDITDKSLGDSLSSAFSGDGKFVDEISSSLPTALHFGVGFQLDKFLKGNFPGNMLIVVGVDQGFNNMPSNSTKTRVSLGVEWVPLSWLPIRTGVSLGGRENFHWGLGFGLDAGLVEFNFAASDFQSIILANNARKIGLSLGARWKF